ncbi:uncharacterized protein LOC110102188 [Dendrobium catenatum]|uniref:Late embryogenesis abundant protein LEA-2 subgroup domain-containing protein n=1 Tax=Dendrobium catenatum TaxID=906689 RepID=A0A2I0XC16_9ASPA|nr:uncharacterized protein LOC110102188 [Dendrobium catenatum]PKU85436.1 hypothetical protein MA16_Dca003175 [Dendrobium catenatum]
MTESGLPRSSSSSPIIPKPIHRRRLPLILLLVFLLLLLLAAIIVILALTVFRPRDPRTQLVSATISGASPHFSLPTLTLSINLTFAFDILVYNPNRASFSHGHGSTRLLYRTAYIGDADVLPGRIPSHGSTHLQVSLTVDGSRLAGETRNLVSDAMAGEVDFDAETRIPGRVKFLGFIKHHAVAISKCHVAVGFPNLKVMRQDCTQKTKL